MLSTMAKEHPVTVKHGSNDLINDWLCVQIRFHSTFKRRRFFSKFIREFLFWSCSLCRHLWASGTLDPMSCLHLNKKNLFVVSGCRFTTRQVADHHVFISVLCSWLHHFLTKWFMQSIPTVIFFSTYSHGRSILCVFAPFPFVKKNNNSLTLRTHSLTIQNHLPYTWLI